jgi:hypothetical protein
LINIKSYIFDLTINVLLYHIVYPVFTIANIYQNIVITDKYQTLELNNLLKKFRLAHIGKYVLTIMEPLINKVCFMTFDFWLNTAIKGSDGWLSHKKTYGLMVYLYYSYTGFISGFIPFTFNPQDFQYKRV